MLIAALGWAWVGIGSHIAFAHNPSLTSFDLLIFRTALMVTVYLTWSICAKTNVFSASSREWNLIFWRGLTGAVGFVSYVYAFHFAPVSESALVFNINPFIIMILAALFLGERITKIEYLFTFFAFGGVAVLCTFKNEKSEKEYPNKLFGLSLALTAACMAGTAYTLVRSMNKTLHYIYSAFYNGFFGIPILILAYFFAPNVFSIEKYTWTDVLLMSGAISGDLIGQVAMSLAFKFEEASRVGPILYMMIVFTYLADIIFFHYEFTLAESLGSLVIFISILTPIILRLMGVIKK